MATHSHCAYIVYHFLLSFLISYLFLYVSLSSLYESCCPFLPRSPFWPFLSCLHCTLFHFTLTPMACGPTPSLWVAASHSPGGNRQGGSRRCQLPAEPSDASYQLSESPSLDFRYNKLQQAVMWLWSLLWLQWWEMVPHICWASPKSHVPQLLQLWAKWHWFTLAHISGNPALFSFEHLTDSKKSRYPQLTMGDESTYFLKLTQ